MQTPKETFHENIKRRVFFIMRNIGNLKLNIKELALLKSKPVEYIEEVLIKSYSHKPYLAQMPYDRNTRNPYKMCARWMALDEYEDDLMKQIEDLDEQCEKAIDNYINSKDQLDQLIHEDLPNARADINSDIGEYGIDVNWDGVEYASDVDEYLQSEKERVRENLVDTIFMDDKFPAHSDVYQDLVELDPDFEEDGLVDTYVKENWLDPYLDATSFVEVSGHCNAEDKQKIDDFISQLESLNISPNSIDDSGTPLVEQREKIINSLRQLQANSVDEIPESDLYQKREDLERRRDVLERDVENYKREVINTKKSVHERNVALYEVANEKQNCADIFSETSGTRENIEEYVGSVDFEQYLNDDRTVKADFLDAQRQVALDNGDPWYE